MITPTESLILSLLIARPAGAYGSELVNVSGDKLKRGTVYTLLGRLEDKGLVKSKEDPPTPELALPRTSYRITAQGQRAFREFGEFTGHLRPALGGV